MKHLAFASLFLLVACGGSEEPAKSADQAPTKTTIAAPAQTASEAAPAPEVAKAEPKKAEVPAAVVTVTPAGELKKGLKKADLDAAKELVHLLDAYDAALGKVTKKLGKPTYSIEGKSYWVAAVGDKCLRLQLEQEGGKVSMVGTSEHPNDETTDLSTSSGATAKDVNICTGAKK